MLVQILFHLFSLFSRVCVCVFFHLEPKARNFRHVDRASSISLKQLSAICRNRTIMINRFWFRKSEMILKDREKKLESVLYMCSQKSTCCRVNKCN